MLKQNFESRDGSLQSWYRGFPLLRRVKPISTDLLQEYSRRDGSNEPKESPSSTSPRSVLTPGNLLRIWLRPPWDDYAMSSLTRKFAGSGWSADECVLACRRGTYFRKASIRAFQSSGGIELLQTLSNIQHPNIAKLYDVYLFRNRIFVASEHLPLSLPQLNLPSFPFDEWEIATVITEVLKGSAYLLFKGLSCKELRMSNIRISTDGNVKIVLDLQQYERQSLEDNSQVSHAILDIPYMADIVEEMMLPRYHLEESEESWSPDALDFLSCCLSGSIESLISHNFLARAKSPSRLAPRVRFAAEVPETQSNTSISLSRATNSSV